MDIEYIKEWRGRYEEPSEESVEMLSQLIGAWRSAKIGHLRNSLDCKIALRVKGLEFIAGLSSLKENNGNLESILEFFRTEAELQLEDLEASKNGLEDKHASDMPSSIWMDWTDDTDTDDPALLAEFFQYDVEEEERFEWFEENVRHYISIAELPASTTPENGMPNWFLRPGQSVSSGIPFQQYRTPMKEHGSVLSHGNERKRAFSA